MRVLVPVADAGLVAVADGAGGQSPRSLPLVDTWVLVVVRLAPSKRSTGELEVPNHAMAVHRTLGISPAAHAGCFRAHR